MKKKITITRREVIKALRTEKLKGGAWFHLDGYDKDPFDKFHEDRKVKVKDSKEFKQCNVCAVGAVLRQKSAQLSPILENVESYYYMADSIANMLDNRCNLDYGGDYDCGGKYCGNEAFGCDGYCTPSKERQLKNLIRDKNYLGALSSFFEDLVDEISERRDTYREDVKIMPVHREKLINFVKKNFPVKFTATIEV